METFTQPKITGYRQLNEAEAALMNEIKSRGIELGELVAKLRSTDGIDQRSATAPATASATATAPASATAPATASAPAKR